MRVAQLLWNSKTVVVWSADTNTSSTFNLDFPVNARFPGVVWLSVDELFVSGLHPEHRNCYVFRVSDGNVVRKADMIHSRHAHACVKYIASVYVFGGYSSTAGKTTAASEAYKLQTDSWESI
jgi:hypothetical protein